MSRSTGSPGCGSWGRSGTSCPRTPFVLLDRLGTALDAELGALVLNVLSENAITYIVFKADRADASYYDAILEIAGDGTWQWKSLRGRRASEPEPSGGALKA